MFLSFSLFRALSLSTTHTCIDTRIYTLLHQKRIGQAHKYTHSLLTHTHTNPPPPAFPHAHAPKLFVALCLLSCSFLRTFSRSYSFFYSLVLFRSHSFALFPFDPAVGSIIFSVYPPNPPCSPPFSLSSAVSFSLSHTHTQLSVLFSNLSLFLHTTLREIGGGVSTFLYLVFVWACVSH